MTSIIGHWRAYSQAYRCYPERWYENTLPTYALAFALIIPLAAVQHRISWRLEFGVAGVIFHLAGRIADISATAQTFAYRATFEKRGIPFRFRETALFVPDQPTTHQLILNRGTALELLMLPAIFLIPTMGFVSLVLSLAAVAVNRRCQKRLRMILESTTTVG
jgi:hypothetical protein